MTMELHECLGDDDDRRQGVRESEGQGENHERVAGGSREGQGQAGTPVLMRQQPDDIAGQRHDCGEDEEYRDDAHEEAR